MTYSLEFVHLRVLARVAWIEFNRAPVNAFNREMVEEVRKAVATSIADPDIRVIVIASAIDSYFSAGADLHIFKGMKADDMHSWVSLCHEIARLLRSSPKPLLAAINGTAVGGGLEMALHCDLRFAASDAKLGQPEIRIAFIPPIATTQTLVRLLGRPKALRYLYEGRLLDAPQALDWGLVDEVVKSGDLRPQVQRYAEDLATKPAAALAAIRRTITVGGGMSFEDGMTLELEMATALADTADFAEGVDAFLHKRAPQWAPRLLLREPFLPSRLESSTRHQLTPKRCPLLLSNADICSRNRDVRFRAKGGNRLLQSVLSQCLLTMRRLMA